MKRDDLDKFEKLVAQFQGSYDEMSLLSKKWPSDAVNIFKLRFINSLIKDGNKFLGAKYKPFSDFSAFDEDDAPQNTDVVFVLAQYLRCFEKYRADNTKPRLAYWYWTVDEPENKAAVEGIVYIPTVRPKGLRE